MPSEVTRSAHGKVVVTRVAKGRKISGNFPWELRVGNFGNIPSLKLTRNLREFTEINWKL